MGSKREMIKLENRSTQFTIYLTRDAEIKLRIANYKK